MIRAESLALPCSFISKERAYTIDVMMVRVEWAHVARPVSVQLGLKTI